MNPLDDLDPGEELSPEQIEFQLDGQQLATIVGTPGWEVVTKILDDMVTEANTKLAAILPGDPTMPVAHAAAFAYQTARRAFLNRVHGRIEAATNVRSNRLGFNILPE
jgi:hypothetical protein